MRSTKYIVVIVSLLALAAQAATGSPLVGASANTLPRGEFMVDFWTVWRNFERSFDTGLYGSGDGGWIDLRSDSALSATSFVPRIYYGVTDWLTVRAALPLEDRYMNFPDAGGVRTNTGIGDVVIDPKIQLYRSESGYPRLSLLTGIMLPTGDTKGVDGSGTLALSDGSTDFLIGGVLTQQMGNLMTHTCVTYWMNGEGDDGIDRKDLWIASATLETPLNEYWSLLWEFKGYWGEDPSAYHRTYACPGISWSSDRLTIGVSNMISIAARGGGGISYVDYNWAPYARVYYRFF